ncbi:hypothetical protein ASF09_02490 [Sphingomonas sp. Leaf242]|nr:hypothetical protein ASF09_02490 [Sphingomonas sp. Leaf242]
MFVVEPLLLASGADLGPTMIERIAPVISGHENGTQGVIIIDELAVAKSAYQPLPEIVRAVVEDEDGRGSPVSPDIGDATAASGTSYADLRQTAFEGHPREMCRVDMRYVILDPCAGSVWFQLAAPRRIGAI